MKKIDVLYHFNEKYAPYAGVSITSLLINNKHFDEIRIFILGENISEDSRNKLDSLAQKYRRQLIFLNTKYLIKLMKNINLPVYRGSYAANMRLFLADIIPEDVNRLLYLDSDTIVEGKLDGIMEMDLGDCPIAMVIDSLGFAHKRELGLVGNYYNSGTIIFQMNIWREEAYTEQIIRHIREVRSHYPMPDQDILNLVCANKIYTLNPKYNLQPIHVIFPWRLYRRIYRDKQYYTQDEMEEALSDPIIYHFFRFCGEFPWNRNNVHPDTELFDRYLACSPWKNYIKIEADLGILFKIEKRLYKMLPKQLFIIIFEMAHKRMVHKANRISKKNEIYESF